METGKKQKRLKLTHRLKWKKIPSDMIELKDVFVGITFKIG